ncbi:MAG: beta-ketoacyl synthase chain length factor [Bacteroidia bacterium]|nr:beta-ketoacyl synthase chain length factor [Bacteroidia bacterium]
MAIYINGLGNISAQKTWDNSQFLTEITEYQDNYLKSVDPDYKEFINPVAIRRMSHVIKMGIASAKICLKDAGLDMPDAIITGTGFGCIEDTEKFLIQVIDNAEEQLTPTAFMQSTHNAVNGQLAIILGCKNYNFTYCQRGFSFENALLDSYLQCKEKPNAQVLVGGFDEISPNYFKVNDRIGMWKKEKISNLALLQHPTEGTIAGEFSTYFVLSDQLSEKSYCELKGLDIYYKPKQTEDLVKRIQAFCEKHGCLTPDLVIYGHSGDITEDFWMEGVRNTLFSELPGAYYKHLCGEHYTASAWATWLGAKIVKENHVPEIVLLPNSKKPAELRQVLLVNNYRGRNFSTILLEKA